MKSFIQELQSIKEISPFNADIDESLQKFQALSEKYPNDGDLVRIRKAFFLLMIIYNGFQNDIKSKQISDILFEVDIPYLIAFINHQFMVLKSKVLNEECQIPGKKNAMSAVEDIQINNTFGNINIEDFNTYLVDIVSYLISKSTHDISLKKETLGMKYSKLMHLFTITQFNLLFKDIWQDCLWCDTKLIYNKQNREYCFDRTNEWHLGYMHGLRAHTDDIQSSLFHPERITFARNFQLIYKLSYNQKIREFVVINDEEDITEVYGYSFAYILSDSYYKQIAEKKISFGKTIFGFCDLLRVYICIVKMVMAIDNVIKLKDFTKFDEMIENYQVKLNRTIILSTINKIYPSKYSIQEIEDMILFLTFSDSNPSLWAFPLIEFKDVYLIVISSVLTPDPLRVFEEWLKKSKIAINEKGLSYEKNIIDTINHICSKNKILENYKIGTFSKKQIGEEIDMIIFLDSTIFVCEIKCNYIFSSSRAFNLYMKDIKHASIQAKRKVECIKSKLPFVCNLMKIQNKSKIEVKPLILSNLFYLSGVSVDDVLVSDLKSLSVYLSGFINNTMIITGKTGVISKNIISKPLYKTQKEASYNLLDFLRNSPLIKRYETSFTRLQIPMSESQYLTIKDFSLKDSLYENSPVVINSL